MQTRSILALLVAAFIVLLAQHGEAGPHPWSGAPRMFKKLMHQSISVSNGWYKIKNAHSGEYMTFFSKGDNIKVERNGNGGGSDLGAQGQYFRIVKHPHPVYHHLYSIHRPNHSGNDKCISAGYSRNADIFALMYMCRVETDSGASGGVTSPNAVIKYDKQLWIFIPGTHGTVKIIAVAQLNDYKPRCIYPKHISGFGAMKPHWYQGLALDLCILDNKKGRVFNWSLEKVK